VGVFIVVIHAWFYLKSLAAARAWAAAINRYLPLTPELQQTSYTLLLLLTDGTDKLTDTRPLQRRLLIGQRQ